MSMLILHEQKTTNWFSLGLGALVDAVNPTVTKARNGEYTLQFQYPMNGPLFDKIKEGNWVVADAGVKADYKAQRFEIQTISKPINGLVTVDCEHYRYQLLRSVLRIGVTTTGTVDSILRFILANSSPYLDFSVQSSGRSGTSTFKYDDPSKFSNTTEALGGVAGSVLDLFGGEYIFNNNYIRLPNEAGTHTNVVIAYGKNLVDINQEQSIENTFTSIYPWAKVKDEVTGDEKILTLPGQFVDSENTSKFRTKRIQSVDFTQQNPKDVAALNTLAVNYVNNNKVGVPKVSIKTSFVDLSQSVMGQNANVLDTVDLCDWVHVSFRELGVSAEAQIIKTVYRPDLDAFESLELGDARTSLGDVIDGKIDGIGDGLQDKVNGLQNDWMGMQQDIDHFNDVLNNPGKGKVVIWPSIEDPQEIYITDNENIALARKMWRWSEAGLAYSSTGRGGPWTVGMTKEGQIVADLINTGTLKAIDIMGVTITGSSFETKGSYSDILISNGVFTITDKNGQKFSQWSSQSLKFFDENGIESAGFSRAKQIGTNDYNTILACENDHYLSLSHYDPASKLYVPSIQINGDDGKIKMTNVEIPYTTADVLWYRNINFGNYQVKKAALVDSYVDNNSNFGVNGGATFTVYNNANLHFYANLNMHGFNILNQSDIRLKENIKKTEIDGIKETKKLDFYEFDRKTMYKSRDENAQPNTERELGMIAQYVPFLSKKDNDSNYLSVDTSKQIMLNTLTNKQLIEVVEGLESRLLTVENKQLKSRKNWRRFNGK